MSRVTVLIASADAIPTLRQQPFLQASLAFTDVQIELAFDEIRRRVPAIVAIERSVAATHPGQELLRNLREDPTLATCQIQTVAVRRSHRHKVRERVLVDGTAATLLDISTTGAHIVCPAALKPAQPLNVALRVDGVPVAAVAVWVQYELPKEGPRYRAGIQFAATAAAPVAQYISEVVR